MIKIYHVGFARSLRIVWLMEELGEPYELEPIALPPDEAFRAISPTGTLPTIVDGDIVMGESIAILQYLTGRRLQTSLQLGLTVGPNPDPAAYAEHLQFLHFGEASLAAPLAFVLRTQRLAPEEQRVNFTVELCRDLFRRRLAVVDRRLDDGRPYLTGERFTIADISVGYALHLAQTRGAEALLTPPALAYLQRLRARPAFQRAVAKQA
jgi:glutathione S-transferase